MKQKSLLALLCIFTFFYSYGQEVTVKGTVIDAANKETLIGVNIKSKTTDASAQTDLNGNFSITVPGDGVLVLSYLGFATQEIAVNNRTTINVELAPSNQQLDQVVVVGYGTQRKRDLTGSITSIKGEEVANQPNVNPVASLQGRVAGLTIVNSGSPGASPTVRIRGVNSTNNSNPLYVVDGVFQSNIDYLNAADIESIEVLKDPSSIAIFGLRGGNGVIVVTTKRAARGETRITYQGSVGMQKVTDLIDVVDANGFKRLYSTQLANINAAPFDTTNYTANTNWQDLIFRTAAITNNSVTISNSGEKSTTLINLGYSKQEGVLKYGDFERFVGRINQEIRINENLKVGGDITASHFNRQGSGVSFNNALWSSPIVPVQADENTYYSMPSFQRAQVGNPIATLDRTNGNEVNKGYRAVANIYAELKLFKQLTLRSAFFTDLSFNGTRGYTPLPNRFINLGEGLTPTDTTIDENGRTSVRQSQDQYRKFQQDHTISYDSVFNNVHRFNAVVGFTTLFEGNTLLSGSRTDTTLNIPRGQEFWYVGISESINPNTLNGTGDENAQIGLLGRVSYGYRDKYLINATIRRDGSSRISPGNRYGTFGAVGLGWVVSEEGFLSGNKFIDFLKFRASWGTVANAQGVSRNFFEPVLRTSGVGVFGENVYASATPDYLPDPNLKWETTRGIDLGVDLRAFDSRLSAEFTVYDRTTKDIISRITLPGAAGEITYLTNLGNISNKGLEVALGWNDKIGRDISFGLSPNFSYNRNNVESLGNNFNFTLFGNGNANRTITGESIGHFFGYRQVGIYQTTSDLDRQPGFANSLPGDIAYADLNGDGVITPADRENLGTPFPIWSYGMNLNLGYKGLDLLIQGQGVAGNHVYTQRRVANFAVTNYETNRLNAWTTPGSTNIEPVLNNTRNNNFLFSSHYLEPGDYFRLRTVQVGYNLTSSMINKTPLKALRVFLSGQNVHTWTKTTGYSPEAPIVSILGGGADNGVYPVPAIYTFGVNATF